MRDAEAIRPRRVADIRAADVDVRALPRNQTARWLERAGINQAAGRNAVWDGNDT
jgi:hypothetical protein